jgi:formylglycine-generating enzyme required for sulfatase activity
MMCVEGGTFIMGASLEDPETLADELPQHEVTLSNYYIGKYEVTQRLWRTIMGSNPSKFIGDDLPVESVTWDECYEFLDKLNAITGLHFRLPTEAEWEYAARGGQKSKGYTYSGSNNINEVAWYQENCNQTQPVGRK